jgi:hypothetical protein
MAPKARVNIFEVWGHLRTPPRDSVGTSGKGLLLWNAGTSRMIDTLAALSRAALPGLAGAR